jgi:hypothetical protein
MRRSLVIGFTLLIVAWALAPAVRGVLLVRRTSSGPSNVAEVANLPAESVRFTASDGIPLAGTYYAVADSCSMLTQTTSDRV